MSDEPRFLPEELAFMRALSSGGAIGYADRKSDRLRQRLRKAKYVYYDRGLGRWALTVHGVQALRDIRKREEVERDTAPIIDILVAVANYETSPEAVKVWLSLNYPEHAKRIRERKTLGMGEG